MTLRIPVATLATTLLLACSCSFGHSRKLDVSRDLSGIDMAYLQSEAKPRFAENSQSIDGQIRGWPFWFLPVGSVDFVGINAQHLGPVSGDDKPPKAAISGYDYIDGSAIGIGLVSYRSESANWDATGKLQTWQSGWGLGWGLVYSTERSGKGQRRAALSSKILGGLFGYSEDEAGSYLHLLWIPIGVGEQSDD